MSTMELESDAERDARTAIGLWLEEGRRLLTPYPCSPDQKELLHDGIEHIERMFETVEK